jgi:hypothetical protein
VFSDQKLVKLTILKFSPGAVKITPVVAQLQNLITTSMTPFNRTWMCMTLLKDPTITSNSVSTLVSIWASQLSAMVKIKSERC